MDIQNRLILMATLLGLGFREWLEFFHYQIFSWEIGQTMFCLAVAMVLVNFSYLYLFARGYLTFLLVRNGLSVLILGLVVSTFYRLSILTEFGGSIPDDPISGYFAIICLIISWSILMLQKVRKEDLLSDKMEKKEK